MREMDKEEDMRLTFGEATSAPLVLNGGEIARLRAALFTAWQFLKPPPDDRKGMELVGCTTVYGYMRRETAIELIKHILDDSKPSAMPAPDLAVMRDYIIRMSAFFMDNPAWTALAEEARGYVGALAENGAAPDKV